MDKKSPSYPIMELKSAFNRTSKLNITGTARKCIVELGMTPDDVVQVIQSLTGKNFYKSMTTHANHKVWQDVYHSEFNGRRLYIKFMKDERGHLIVSFKER